MKNRYEITESQRMALCSMLVDVMRSSLMQRYLDCSQSPPVEATVEDLVDIFMQPRPVRP